MRISNLASVRSSLLTFKNDPKKLATAEGVAFLELLIEELDRMAVALEDASATQERDHEAHMLAVEARLLAIEENPSKSNIRLF